jgi:hypothetical protein
MRIQHRRTSDFSRSSVASVIAGVIFLFVIGGCQDPPPVNVSETPRLNSVNESNSAAPTLTPGEEAVKVPPGMVLRPITVQEIKERGPRCYCVPQQPGTVQTVGPIKDSPWTLEGVTLNTRCEGEFRLRHEDGSLEEVPVPPGTYYSAMGRQIDGWILIVLTHVEHGEFVPDPNREGRLYTNEVNPTIMAIIRMGEGWSQPSTVVDREEAVWLAGIGSDWSITYLQDSLFEHLLLNQEGRPDSDGFYRADLEVLPNGKIVANNPQRTGDYALPNLMQ